MNREEQIVYTLKNLKLLQQAWEEYCGEVLLDMDFYGGLEDVDNINEVLLEDGTAPCGTEGCGTSCCALGLGPRIFPVDLTKHLYNIEGYEDKFNYDAFGYTYFPALYKEEIKEELKLNPRNVDYSKHINNAWLYIFSSMWDNDLEQLFNRFDELVANNLDITSYMKQQMEDNYVIF